jgi:hypothetical protein
LHIIGRERPEIARESVGKRSQSIAQVVQVNVGKPVVFLGRDHFGNSIRDRFALDVRSMMSCVETRCIDQRGAVKESPSLAVFKRDGIQRHAVLADRILRSAVFEPVTARELHRVDVATGELRCFGFGFTLCSLQLVEMQPVPFAAQMVDDAIICAGRLTIAINLDDGRTAFDMDWESNSFCCHKLYSCLSARILSDK